MKAAVFHGPNDIRLDDVAEPDAGRGSVKVKVDWCGICGTDLHEYLAGPIFIPPAGQPHPLTGEAMPVTLGHEFAGTVVDVGTEVDGVAAGDPVAIEPVLRCGECPACRRGVPNMCEKLGFYGLAGGGGGMSEFAVVPGYTVHKLPAGLTTEQGALVEPIAVGLRAVRRSGLEQGQSALVLGAGPIGAVTLLCLKAAGASPVIVAEVAEARKRKALELGADAVVDPSSEDVAARVKELTGGEGVDHSYDAAGIEITLQTAIRATRKSGSVTIISIWEKPACINPNEIVLAELDVHGIIAYTPEDFADTIAMITDGRIDTTGVVTSRIDLGEVVAGGFDELVAHKDRHVKILVRSPAA
jgi:(R,R)-butanediol dehydrogenase / meso-butanediol dehydrogenase / diacetyl reductase